jgi:sugar phosphate isomerase/epimerase
MNNPCIYFTKFMQGLSVEQIALTAKAMGFDGLDLAIRKGQTINPDNVAKELPPAMGVFTKHGIKVPHVTLEGNATDPKQKELETIFACCGAAGIGLIKLGYWLYKPGQDYVKTVGEIRAALAGFEQLGRKYNVCSLVHTHCDGYYGCNAAGARALVEGYDPRYVGIYLDAAHLAHDGEALPMAVAIARSHLRMIAVKNVRYKQTAENPARFKAEWVPLDQGLVYWPDAVKLFKDIEYSGPYSLHGEYSATDEFEKVKPIVTKDLAYFRSIIK